MCKQSIGHNYDVKLEIDCKEKVDVRSWGKLVKTLNFVGCEVLVVDAEGCDTKILRSLIAFCRENPEHWPELIQFETMGHCDRQEKLGAEKALIEAFQGNGYTVISLSDHNSYVINDAALEKEKRLQRWVYRWVCYGCGQQWSMPYICCWKGIFSEECHDWMISEKKTYPLKMGRRMDDLTKSSPVWNTPGYDDDPPKNYVPFWKLPGYCDNAIPKTIF